MKNNEYAYHDFARSFPRSERNFIRENVKSIKQMQGLLQEAGVIQPRQSKEDKFKSVPSIRRSRDNSPVVPRTSSNDRLKVEKTVKRSSLRPRLERGKEKTEIMGQRNSKFTHRAMQTERAEDLAKLYESGTIKYPSPGVARSKASPRASPYKTKGQGDAIEEGMQNLDIEGKDFVKENMSNIKPKTVKQIVSKVPAQAPPSYQRGVVPKYLRDRKEEDVKQGDEEPCPAGHVLLPEEERKETLRVLRQSYADRIQELNSLPVRSDTLRVKRRKMEIEEELKRIDGGIKVFQRPKVYVKINA
ncbi:enkurin domain-containing protein 1 isoform X2 [Anoplophora glabripennis]|uniref:enkurin domain-containing protein 1 isoform X2 n=1 Tax=Anoplophora glabripennis TaxID=217634 RepID=UPI0008752407|nr:enkurin domain-containing protein 1 isoform X2 [Anoplophora glabripennis]